MSALEIANQTLTAKKIPAKFLELFVEKFSGKDFTMDSLKEDEDMAEFFTKKKAKKVASSKSPEDLKGRAMEPVCEHKCQARVWAGGYGGQCARKHLEDGCLCTLHQKAMNENGKWWLGMVCTPRPEDPIHPKNGKVHRWLITSEGEEVEKKASPKKTSPKKKKASPKKKAEKKAEGEKPVSASELSIQELTKLLAEKKATEDALDDDGVGVGLEEDTLNALGLSAEGDSETQTKVVDGVEYNYDPSTNMIIDPNDFSEMGEWDEEESCIRFEDDDVEDKHQQYRDECA
jgi:hypothetical protein